MLRKINITLAIIAVIGAVALVSCYAYDHFAKLENSKIIKQLEG